MRFAGRTAALAAAVCAGLVGISTNASAATPAGPSAADALTLDRTYGAPLYLQDDGTAGTATPTPDAPPKPDKPLAGMMKKAGWDTGDIQIYGFIEGSYTYGFSN